jgi:LPS O-antigen subunit length determinant protein (WzzB/FepE family)
MPANQSLDLIYLFNLLLCRWRFLAAGTLIIMIAAAVGTFMAEETYESSAKLLVSSPKFATGLDVFPRQLSEPTFGQMAQSGVVYEDLIQVMQALHKALLNTRDDREAALETARGILRSSTQELATRFGWEPSDAKITAVQALSAKDIAGLRMIDPDAFEVMDTRTLSEMLDVKSEIEFEGPNVIQWEPLIELKARASAPETAASIANIWARITLEHVRAVVELGTEDALEQLSNAYTSAQGALQAVQERIKSLNQTTMGDAKKERLKGILEDMYGHGLGMLKDPFYRQYSDTRARIRELEQSVADLRQLVASLEVNGEWIGSLGGGGDKEKATAPPVIRQSTAANEAWLRRVALLRVYTELRRFKEQNPIEAERSHLAEAVKSLRDLRSERSTFAAMVKVSPSISDGTKELNRLDSRISELEQFIAETNDRIAAMEQGLQERQLEVTRAEEEWTAYRDEYIRLRSELFSREEELLSKRALLASLEAQIQDASAEIDRLNHDIEEYQSKLAALEAELLGKQTAYEQITALHAQVQVASRTPFASLKLISAAPIPKTRVSPKRRLIVLVAAFIGFILLSGWIIVHDNLRRYRQAQAMA